jgi:hypothetical protein
MLIEQKNVEPDHLITTVEQAIKIGAQFTGEIPSIDDGGEDILFVPYMNDADGIYRMMRSATTPTVVEGDKGGLFLFANKVPVRIEYILADLGTSQAWNLHHALAHGNFPIANATSQYIRRTFDDDGLILAPTEGVKLITTAATKAMWMRVGVSVCRAL